MKIIAIGALVISCAATAQPVTPYQRQDASAAKTDDNKIVCKKQETIGTRLGAKKVCLTVSEWAVRAHDDRERTEQVQSSTCQVGEMQACSNPNLD